MKPLEPIENQTPSPDGYYTLVGMARLTCGRCGCQVAPELRERHRKMCLFPKEPVEEAS